jgi:hypothetical protein
LTDDYTFHPEFTHQVFGDSEKIYGYEDLKIQVCRATLYIFKDIPLATRALHAQAYWQTEVGNRPRFRATTNKKCHSSQASAVSAPLVHLTLTHDKDDRACIT